VITADSVVGEASSAVPDAGGALAFAGTAGFAGTDGGAIMLFSLETAGAALPISTLTTRKASSLSASARVISPSKLPELMSLIDKEALPRKSSFLTFTPELWSSSKTSNSRMSSRLMSFSSFTNSQVGFRFFATMPVLNSVSLLPLILQTQ